MPRLNMPQVRPTPMVVPTRDYPHLKRLMKEVDFACATCSSAMGQPVYHTLEEAVKEPVSGVPTKQGTGIVGPKGMVATRFLVLCPECRTVPENNPLMPGGYCDLMDIDPGYIRPFRPQGDGGDGVTYDGDDDEPKAAVVSNLGKGRHFKKTSDLNPKTRKQTAKEKRLIAEALASNNQAVPKDAVSSAKKAKPAKAKAKAKTKK